MSIEEVLTSSGNQVLSVKVKIFLLGLNTSRENNWTPYFLLGTFNNGQMRDVTV